MVRTMQDKTKELVKWSQDNKVLINCNKTREMILGKAKLDNIPRLQINGNQIERVSDFKILGLQLSDNLYWDCNVEFIYNKISSKLYISSNSILKRAGLSTDDFLSSSRRNVSRKRCEIELRWQ